MSEQYELWSSGDHALPDVTNLFTRKRNLALRSVRYWNDIFRLSFLWTLSMPNAPKWTNWIGTQIIGKVTLVLIGLNCPREWRWDGLDDWFLFVTGWPRDLMAILMWSYQSGQPRRVPLLRGWSVLFSLRTPAIHKCPLMTNDQLTKDTWKRCDRGQRWLPGPLAAHTQAWM